MSILTLEDFISTAALKFSITKQFKIKFEYLLVHKNSSSLSFKVNLSHPPYKNTPKNAKCFHPVDWQGGVVVVVVVAGPTLGPTQIHIHGLLLLLLAVVVARRVRGNHESGPGWALTAAAQGAGWTENCSSFNTTTSPSPQPLSTHQLSLPIH